MDVTFYQTRGIEISRPCYWQSIAARVWSAKEWLRLPDTENKIKHCAPKTPDWINPQISPRYKELTNVHLTTLVVRQSKSMALWCYINLFQNSVTFMNIDYSFSEHFKRKWKSLLSLKYMRFVQPRNYSTVYYLFWIAVSSSCVLISLHHAFNYK